MSQGNRPKRKPLRREQKVLLAVAMVFMVYIFAFCYVPIAGWGLSVFRYKPAFGLNFAKQMYQYELNREAESIRIATELGF